MEKKLARLFTGMISVLAMVFGTLVYGLGELWFAVCDMVDEGAIQVIWKAECFPYYLGSFGQRLGELLMTVDEKFWNMDIYKEAPVAIFLAGVVGIVLTTLSPKLTGLAKKGNKIFIPAMLFFVVAGILSELGLKDEIVFIPFSIAILGFTVQATCWWYLRKNTNLVSVLGWFFFVLYAASAISVIVFQTRSPNGTYEFISLWLAFIYPVITLFFYGVSNWVANPKTEPHWFRFEMEKPLLNALKWITE